MQNDVCLPFMCLIAAVHVREREREKSFFLRLNDNLGSHLPSAQYLLF